MWFKLEHFHKLVLLSASIGSPVRVFLHKGPYVCISFLSVCCPSQFIQSSVPAVPLLVHCTHGLRKWMYETQHVILFFNDHVLIIAISLLYKPNFFVAKALRPWGSDYAKHVNLLKYLAKTYWCFNIWQILPHENMNTFVCFTLFTYFCNKSFLFYYKCVTVPLLVLVKSKYVKFSSIDSYGWGTPFVAYSFFKIKCVLCLVPKSSRCTTGHIDKLIFCTVIHLDKILGLFVWKNKCAKYLVHGQ